MYELSLKNEILRKIFHLTALVFPLYYQFASENFLGVILITLLSFTFLVDKLRSRFNFLSKMVNFIFCDIMREEEKKKISGITYMLSGFLTTFLLFEKSIVIASWFILIISDMLAAVVGKTFPSRKFSNGKSLSGSLSFFVSSAIIIYIYSDYFLFKYLFVSLMLTLVELYAKNFNINDNFLIPLSSSVLLYLIEKI